MKRYFQSWRIVAVLVVFLATSCSTQTKQISSWKDESYTGGYLTRVMVVGVSDKKETRTMFEDLFAKEFEKTGVSAVSAIAISPRDQEIDKNAVKEEANKRSIEAVFVTHLVGVKEEAVYHPPPLGASSYYGSFSSYYPSVYAYTHQPGYYTQHKRVRLESSLYAVSTEKLIWSFQTETIDAKSIKDMVDSLGKAVMADLKKNGLLK